METTGPTQLLEQLAGVTIGCADTHSCKAVLQSVERLIAWAEAVKVTVAARLSELARLRPEISPEHTVADATRVSLGRANEPFRRAAAVEAMPAFGQALAGGDVSVAHVDVVATALGKLHGQDRERFEAREDFLLGVAGHATPGEFARTVRAEVIRCRREDGINRLMRQKQATRLSTWVDQTTGMYHLRGEFDPETGARLHNRLHATMEKLFHGATPDTSPRDPLEKQQHLRALSLVALVDGEGAAAGGVDMTVLIDAKTLVDGVHEHSVVDCGLPIDLPLDTIRRMACIADVTPVIVGADGVRLYLGRTTRLASPAQRRALRAMYRRCAVPGCSACWDSVVIHHLKYFRHGGLTDIDNLLPLCIKHHHFAHEGGWQFRLGLDRTLTIVRPDGSTFIHAPPRALAA
jgi:hypothetical protein